MSGPVGTRTHGSRLVTFVAGAVVMAFSMLPVYVMLAKALDPTYNDASRSLLPDGLTLENFSAVFTENDFGTYLLNSLLVAIGTVVLCALTALLAAVAVSRFKFRARTSVLIMILIVQMVPMEALVIPLNMQMQQLNLTNHLISLMGTYLAFSLPFAVWTMRGFVSAVPVELEEAAYVDGASWRQMFWKVLFPLVAPGLVAISVFSFITAWNEFVFAYTFMTDSSNYTAAVGLREFFRQNGTAWGLLMAGSTLITVPVMIFFVAVQKRLAGGLTAGAVKG